MTLKAIGASTGRAGSVWIATVMHNAGIPVLHETHFNGDRCLATQPDVWDHREVAEWSAQAVPYLGSWDVTVWHQVRHPLDVTASYLKFGLFEFPERFGRQGQVIFDRFDLTGDPTTDAVRFWVDWNRRIEPHATRRWRVEDVDADLIVEAGTDAGVQVDRDKAVQALQDTPRQLNTAGPTLHPVLPDHPATEALFDMACRYGYEVNDG